MNLTIHELENLLHHFRNHSLHEEIAAMKQDISDKLAALTTAQNDQTTQLGDLTSTVKAAETLLDGLVAQGANAPTDPAVLAALDTATAAVAAKNVEIANLKAELAAKVVADTPA